MRMMVTGQLCPMPNRLFPILAASLFSLLLPRSYPIEEDMSATANVLFYQRYLTDATAGLQTTRNPLRLLETLSVERKIEKKKKKKTGGKTNKANWTRVKWLEKKPPDVKMEQPTMLWHNIDISRDKLVKYFNVWLLAKSSG